MLPFAGVNRVTSPYGLRILQGRRVNHTGIDIVGNENKNVLAVKGGKVMRSNMITDRANLTWEWGNYVCIKTLDGSSHYYCHMQSRAVKVGDIVHEGDNIGVMGNTGKSFGAHLHFEVRNTANISVDPTKILGIPNGVGTYACSITISATHSNQETKKLSVFGGAKGLNVQSFTCKDVNCVAQDKAGVDMRVADGEYDILSFEGNADGYTWCRIQYDGQPVFMPTDGAVADRCRIQ